MLFCSKKELKIVTLRQDHSKVNISLLFIDFLKAAQHNHNGHVQFEPRGGSPSLYGHFAKSVYFCGGYVATLYNSRRISAYTLPQALSIRQMPVGCYKRHQGMLEEIPWAVRCFEPLWPTAGAIIQVTIGYENTQEIGLDSILIVVKF